MVWFKIDDGFWSHPKVLELSDGAVALWARAGAYSAGHLTDGVVKGSTLRLLASDRDHAVELVLAGLWDEHPDGYVFHDWVDYQPTREQVEAEREATRARVAKSRERRSGNGVSNGVTAPVSNGVSNSAPSRPVPSRPDPTMTTSQVSHATPVDNSARGTLSGLGINPDRLMSEIKSHTGRQVGPVGALQVAMAWLDRGVNVKKPLPYLVTCLREGAVEVQQFIDENGLST